MSFIPMYFAGSFQIYEFLESFKLSELTVTNKGLLLSTIECGVSTKSKLERFHDLFPSNVFNISFVCLSFVKCIQTDCTSEPPNFSSDVVSFPLNNWHLHIQGPLCVVKFAFRACKQVSKLLHCRRGSRGGEMGEFSPLFF